MPITDEELSSRLAQLALPDPRIDPSAARSLLSDAAGQRRRPRRRLRILGISTAALIAIGSLAGPGAAVAGRLFEAQSGEFQRTDSTESLRGDEWIRASAPDFGAYVASTAPRDLPVPGGFDWDGAARLISERYRGSDISMQRIRIVDDYEREVVLAWTREWIVADASGDSARRDAAISVLRKAPSWPGIVASDGGGIRSSLWELIDRMALGGPEAGLAARTLANQRDGSPSTPELRAMHAESLRSWLDLSARYPDLDRGSPVWAEYEALLRRLEAGEIR
ncbi:MULTISPECIES: hypothetical protein [unclassified Leucobacter]|uniref:hypothetical protein n=1 Tax=unclassified Leucobacter TaxID=2621730 RepID=UPI000622AE71|nr:hypothetical protein [Leucobacter sp. Ag1]KKI20152.1 hypothetical protein XM48_08310 [Leucobacter sp. Ag1]